VKNVIKVRALDDEQARAVMKLSKFGSLKPVRCSRCGHGGSFARRIFAISGVPKSKFCDDVTQETISSYITATFGIAYVFFKTPATGNKLYADSAICPECQSTRIVFDIELSEDFFREAAKALGHPDEEL
jgi:ribosomal protein S14